MSKDIKNLMINALAEHFKEIEECVVIDISTLDSSETTEFRNTMREQNVAVRGIKTSLAKKAFAGSDLENGAKLLKGHSYIASSSEDVVSLAKSLVNWAKSNDKLLIKGGVYEGQCLDAQGVVDISKMPSREELLASIVLKALSPGSSIASQLKAPGSQILGAVESLVERLEKQ